MILGILFDLDDTLTDRDQSWLAFLESITKPNDALLLPCSLPDVHRLIIEADRGGYRPKDELFEELRTKLPWRMNLSAAEIEAIWRQRFPSCTVLREDAKSMLKELRARGIRLGIVTNGRVDTQMAKIAAMGVSSLFQAIIISELVGMKKPEPGIFHCALEKLALAPSECLFVGDDPERDVVGPANIGLKTVWLANGRP
jgi:putative hydrolase of the HAD superfamily